MERVGRAYNPAMTDKQLIALRLRERLGSNKAVADVFEISQTSASRLLARARKSLEAVALVRAAGGDAIDVAQATADILRVRR